MGTQLQPHREALESEAQAMIEELFCRIEGLLAGAQSGDCEPAALPSVGLADAGIGLATAAGFAAALIATLGTALWSAAKPAASLPIATPAPVPVTREPLPDLFTQTQALAHRLARLPAPTKDPFEPPRMFVAPVLAVAAASETPHPPARLVGVIETAGKPVAALLQWGERFDEHVPGGEVGKGWRLERIEADRVILKRKGHTHTLTIGGD
ncbi:hypothetical protein [Gloeobacter morelensis]|uniref:Type II secretion system protein GspC N-terminal domain-containing protein n=1 Tax=Gloeobacter morelensis MG652769 TaxID=2781736 RepID=A0ABY3PI82_9CYAN|nr:hypothetical protein [Gloeobacter morelensis]UFP93386.1 hypothetical protein ISF26_16490 [Gloeobacter morelensis MG652769]